MKVHSQTLSRGLVCSALLAAVSGATSNVHADPTDIFGAVAWDDAAFFGNVVDAWDFGAVTGTNPHTYGTVQSVGSFFSGADPLVIDSSQEPRPGWDWQVSIDFLNSGISNVYNAYGFDRVSVYLYIKELGTTAPISGVHAKYNGAEIGFIDLAPGDPQGFILQFLINDMVDPTGLVTGVLTIQWNQVPAPGALALLGLAGMASRRRRRQ